MNGRLLLYLGAALAAALAPHGTARSETLGRVVRTDPRFDALVPPGAVLERLAGGFQWAEGPAWDRAQGALLFSDVPANAIFRWKEGGSARVFLRPSGYTGKAAFTGREPGSNGLAFDGQGRLVLCQHGDRRIARREKDGSITVLAARYQGKRLNSPNDLVFKANGDLYFTDPPFGLPAAFDDPARELSFQGVYRLSRDGTLTLLTRDVRAPNGIGFSPDEKTLYVSNAELDRPVWYAFAVEEDGTLGKGRIFHDATAWAGQGPGAPDGLKVDVHGNVFAAGPRGIHVFAPDGTLLGSIETGVATGNSAFGGDGSVLYVTAGGAIGRIPTRTRWAGWDRLAR